MIPKHPCSLVPTKTAKTNKLRIIFFNYFLGENSRGSPYCDNILKYKKRKKLYTGIKVPKARKLKHCTEPGLSLGSDCF
jgi:hypothetical protein